MAPLGDAFASSRSGSASKERAGSAYASSRSGRSSASKDRPASELSRERYSSSGVWSRPSISRLRRGITQRIREFSDASSSHSHAKLSAVLAARKRAVDCIRFKRKEMLRGSRNTGVLRGFGRIFAESEGSESTFDLSTPVDRIDYFISHNWSTPRRDKFGALALYFNWRKAFAAMWVSALLTVPLAMVGVPPMPKFNSSTLDSGAKPQSVSASVVGCVVLLLTLAFGHEVFAFLGCKGPVCFLDKTCIHQTDAALKREGIEHLAAFLENSKAMIVIYSNTYLQKLWTVYELASLLLLHPGRRVVVIPCFLPKLVVTGIICYSLIMWGQRAILLPGIGGVLLRVPGLSSAMLFLTFLFLVIACVFLQKILLEWARDRAEIRQVVESFSIRQAVCWDEADREVVQGNIVSFVRELGLVPVVEGEDEMTFHGRALDAFDDLVRTEVPPALAASFGRQGIPYRYLLLMFSSQVLRGVDQVAAYIIRRVPVRQSMLLTVEYLVVWAALCPILTALLCRVSAWTAAAKENRSPMRRRLCSFAQCSLVLLFGFGSWYWVTNVGAWAAHDDLWLAVFLATASVLFLLVAAAYRPVRSSVNRIGLSKILESTMSDAASSVPSS